jgi:FeS assembly SUF system protein
MTNVDVKDFVIEKLRSIYDPEIPVNIYELGMVYEVKVDEQNHVYVKMTLTSPMCPVAESLPGEVKEKIKSVPGVSDVYIDLVWDPPWNKDMMSEEAKLILGFF